MTLQTELSKAELPNSQDKQAMAVIDAGRRNPDIFAELMGFQQAPIHTELQDFLTDHGDASVGLPRGHGKSIQVGLREAWEIGKNPNIRIKHIAQIDDKATEQIRFITALMESNVYKLIFPELEILSSTASGIMVKRKFKGKDLTIQACGIFGRAGGRADLLIADDVCDIKNSIFMPSERAKVKLAWYNNWLPMRAFADGTPRTWRLFTPYHGDDLTVEWKKRAELDNQLFWRPCVGSLSPWADVWTKERLEDQRKEMGHLAYARAYELIPISQDQLIFQPDWLERAYYKGEPNMELPSKRQVVAAIDWAFTAKGGEAGDFSVCIIAEIDHQSKVWITDIIRVQTTFPEFLRRAVAACERQNVSLILAEGNGPQAGLCQQLSAVTQIGVRRLNRTKDKVTRASEAQPMVEQGCLKLKCTENGRVDQAQEIIRDEMIGFPAAEHDDTVDSIVDLLNYARSVRYDIKAKPTTVTNNQPKLWRIYGK